MDCLSGRSGRETVEGLLQEVADREGVDPVELPPLYETVDPDALEVLVDGAESDDLRIQFSYVGYHVTIDGDGTVTIDDAVSIDD